MSSKILIVEDNDFVRMQIKSFLEGAGYNCEEAAQGDIALDIIDDSFDAAVVDVRMEPIDGLGFVKALRARELNTPVVLVTGDQSPDLLSESGKLGVSGVLIKPVEKDRLIKMVERLIAMRKRRPS